MTSKTSRAGYSRCSSGHLSALTKVRKRKGDTVSFDLNILDVSKLFFIKLINE